MAISTILPPPPVFWSVSPTNDNVTDTSKYIIKDRLVYTNRLTPASDRIVTLGHCSSLTVLFTGIRVCGGARHLLASKLDVQFGLVARRHKQRRCFNL